MLKFEGVDNDDRVDFSILLHHPSLEGFGVLTDNLDEPPELGLQHHSHADPSAITMPDAEPLMRYDNVLGDFGGFVPANESEIDDLINRFENPLEDDLQLPAEGSTLGLAPREETEVTMRDVEDPSDGSDRNQAMDGHSVEEEREEPQQMEETDTAEEPGSLENRLQPGENTQLRVGIDQDGLDDAPKRPRTRTDSDLITPSVDKSKKRTGVRLLDDDEGDDKDDQESSKAKKQKIEKGGETTEPDAR